MASNSSTVVEGSALLRPRVDRLGRIFAAALRQLAAPLAQITVSALAVRTTSLAAWGEVTALALLVGLAAHLPAFGIKDALLVRWAKDARAISRDFAGAISVRLPLLLVSVAGAAALAPAHRLTVALWLSAHALGLWCEPLIVFRRRLAAAAAMDIAGAAVSAALVGSLVPLPVALAAGAAARAVGLVSSVRGDLATPRRTEARLLAGRPYFVINLLGLAQARAEAYVAALLLSPAVLGGLQLFLTIVGLLRAAGQVLNEPFAVGLLRLPVASHARLTRRRALLAGGLAPIGVAAGALLIALAHGVLIPWQAWLAGAITIAASWSLGPAAYALFGNRRAAVVAWISAAGALVGASLTVAWGPSLGVVGAAWAGAAAQVLMLALYGRAVWGAASPLRSARP